MLSLDQLKAKATELKERCDKASLLLTKAETQHEMLVKRLSDEFSLTPDQLSDNIAELDKLIIEKTASIDVALTAFDKRLIEVESIING